MSIPARELHAQLYREHPEYRHAYDALAPEFARYHAAIEAAQTATPDTGVQPARASTSNLNRAD
jgi:hypothetical protein